MNQRQKYLVLRNILQDYLIQNSIEKLLTVNLRSERYSRASPGVQIKVHL